MNARDAWSYLIINFANSNLNFVNIPANKKCFPYEVKANATNFLQYLPWIEKSKAQKSMKVPVSLILPAPEQKLLASVLDDLKAVTTTQTITTGKRTVTILA